MFVIVAFSKQHAEMMIKAIESRLPFLQNSLSNFLEKWKQQFFAPPSSDGVCLGYDDLV